MGTEIANVRSNADVQFSRAPSPGEAASAQIDGRRPKMQRLGAGYFADLVGGGDAVNFKPTHPDRIEGEPPAAPPVDKRDPVPAPAAPTQPPPAPRRGFLSKVGDVFRNFSMRGTVRTGGTLMGLGGVGYAGSQAFTMFQQTGVWMSEPMLGLAAMAVGAIGSALLVRRLARKKQPSAQTPATPPPAAAPVQEPVRSQTPAPVDGARTWREVIRRTPDGQSVVVLEEVRSPAPEPAPTPVAPPADAAKDDEEPAISKGIKTLGAVGALGGMGWGAWMAIGGAAAQSLVVPFGIAIGTGLTAMVLARGAGAVWNRFFKS
ncbi:MAG: hypothetical protein AAFU77_09095 [Myxococcota bacterium]